MKIYQIQYDYDEWHEGGLMGDYNTQETATCNGFYASPEAAANHLEEQKTAHPFGYNFQIVPVEVIAE
jgi:hypothetical protein